MHFIESERRPEASVKFACADHDFGAYWVDFKRFTNPDERSLTHIAEKMWGLHPSRPE